MKPNIYLTTGGNPKAVLKNFLEGVKHDFYLVKIIHQNRSYCISRYWYPEQLLEAVGFMMKKNQEGFNIYARPADRSFVMLDDLRRDKLEQLAALQPCALLETSPGNFQAWLKLRNMPIARDLQTGVWKALAHMLDADMKSAKPDQIGRLPGFLNMKPKYEPDYPLVKIHKFEDRFSTWQPSIAPITSEKYPTDPPAAPPLWLKRNQAMIAARLIGQLVAVW